MPNLPRPWYYLGMIALNQGDSARALKYISISETLSWSDYLPTLFLSKYYFHNNDSSKGADYKKKTILFLEELNSERNRKYQVWYNSKPLNNQIIPTMLQYEIIPDIYFQNYIQMKQNQVTKGIKQQ